MLKNMKFLLGILLIVFTACAKNEVLVNYEFKGKKQKVSAQQVLTDISQLYAQIPAEEFENFTQSTELLKSLIFARMVEPQLLEEKALEISNFIEDPNYIAQEQNQKTGLIYQLAFQQGLKKLDKDLNKQKFDVAEISRIVISNGSPLYDGEVDGMSVQGILDQILNSEDQINEFATLAEKYSQIPSESVAGGYLGHILKGFFLDLDKVIFEKKYSGLYPTIITTEQVKTILFVHSYQAGVKVSEIEQKFTIAKNNVENSYLSKNIELLYDIQQSEVGAVFLSKGKEITESQMNDKLAIVKFWGKTYTIGQLKDIFTIFLGGDRAAVTPQNIMSLLHKEGDSLSAQLAIIFKGYNNRIKNSKEYKELLSENLDSLKLQNVYTIMSAVLFQDISTNVTTQELREFYSNTNNRPIVSMSENGTPVYASFAESQEELKQTIVGLRAQEVQNNFRAELETEYNVVWNEDKLANFAVQVQEDFDNYVSENPQPEGSFNFQ